MTTFSKLKFKSHPFDREGKQAIVFFPNGYGASVIFSPFSSVCSIGRYELAVIEGDANEWDLCYTTPVTDDVIGWLTPRDVTKLLRQIAALPPVEAA